MTASIHRRVLLWVMGALLLGATVLVGSSWWTLHEEMGEVFEDNLKQVALAVASHHGALGTTPGPRAPPRLPRTFDEYGTFEFVTATWTRDGRRVYTSDESISLPFLSRNGASTVSAGGESWQLYTIVLDDGIVQAAQRTREREQLARETASKLVPPALGLLVLVAALVTLALRRGLAPLSIATSEVTARNVQALYPIALDSHPPELRPLIGAINDLMARLGQALELQRHFLADAAHELRTPMTALRLQLQLLERAGDTSQREAAQAELRTGIDRAQHLIEQLLQLSRLAPEAPPLSSEPVDLVQLARATVTRFSARADDSGIDLGVVPVAPASVLGDARQLGILLDNLVDNAMRHTPRSGRVDVAVEVREGRPRLSVTDSGPGIAAPDRERVFDRFYRAGTGARAGTGSGLGLAIVKAVADRHGALVALADAPQGGLQVSVDFGPPAP